MSIPKMTLRVPKALLASQRKDVVVLLRLGAGVNAMEAMVRLMLRVGSEEQSAIDAVSRVQSFTAALAYLREIVKTIEGARYVDRFFELVQKGLPFSPATDLPLSEVRPLLSSTHPDIGGNVLLKIRDKIAFHWDPGPFEALLDEPGSIDFFIIDGAPNLDRIFAASAYAVAGFALRVPLDGKSVADFSVALNRAVELVGHALEAACLGLIVETDASVPPTNYLVAG
jgi:hypothetical protein